MKAIAAILASRSLRAAGLDAGSFLDVQVLSVAGADGTGAREHQVLLALPTASAGPVPLVILLHGLAETSDEQLGSRAWIDRYGLAIAAERLARPPVAPIARRDDWGAHLGALNADLATRPFRGLAFACPFLPRLRDAQLAAYGRWLRGSVVPAARAAAGSRVDGVAPVLGGCSLGARVALDVFLQAPEAFRAWAGLQSALSTGAVASYADGLARAGKPVLIETSTLDPFREPSAALAAALKARGAPVDFVTLPGPHDQPWLRESGTPWMLRWIEALP